ncbi:hypothetical protein AMTRI_Chr09g13410 [Amborella trichopoda]
MGFSVSITGALVMVLVCISGMCSAQLSSNFYDTSCPKALSTIRSAIRSAISDERRMGASLIRLHFHDCFVNGCDGSLLLDDTSSFRSEKNSRANNNSARGFEVIDEVKSEVESICPGVVSCADILAVAARDSSEAMGGPTWTVKLGRRDSATASESAANDNLPTFRDNLEELISLFSRKGLDRQDMVALSGAHTIGQAQCFTFRERIYNEANIDSGFSSTRQSDCPTDDDDDELAPLDLVTPRSFDNNYFKNLVELKGLLHSDQVLFSNGSTDGLVTTYSNSQSTFFTDFASAMVKMGDIEPLTGSSGQIRANCRVPN